MNNHHAWEHEYQNPRFLTLGTEPLSDVRDFMKWVKKQVRKNPTDFSVLRELHDWTVLDMGCGNGKNLRYIVEYFCKFGIGYDISETAIDMARDLAGDVPLQYQVQSISERLPLQDGSVQLVLDTTSSNALTTFQRTKFLSEVNRVLCPGGLLFTRALCLDGDTNAKNLIKENPGPEQGMYVLSDTGITEKAFTRDEIINTYSQLFHILHIEKTTGYQRWGNQKYKRNYWVMYLQKKR